MIEPHFGLRRRPFPATPDLACYYPATTHEQALGRLLAGLADGEGMLLLTGAPGTGKTLLCHGLIDRLGSEVDCAFLTHTHVHGPAGLLQALLYDLSLPHQGRPEQDMRLALIDHLIGRYRDGKRCVLLIDEAQHLNPEQLEELRLLGNLEGQDGRAVQVVLVGQPEILDTLARPQLTALRQRIAVRVHLDPLGVEEAADYLLHHLRLAGGAADRIVTQEALELLARQTAGVPRLLNQAAHQALRLAAEGEAPEVDAEAVLEVLARLGLGCPADVEAEGPAGEPAAEQESDPAYRLFRAPGWSA